MHTISKLKRERIQIFLKLVKTLKNDYLLLKKRLDDVNKDTDENEDQSISMGNEAS
jgi:hypothetical protein